MKRYHAIPWIEISGGTLASAMFLIAWFGAGAGFLSCLAGISILVGWRLAMGTDLSLAEAYVSVNGLPPEVAAHLMNEVDDTLHRIQKCAKGLPDPAMKARLGEIYMTATGLVEQIRAHPEKLAATTRFLQVYLPGVATASEKLIALGDQGKERAERFSSFLAQAQSVCVSQQRALTADAGLDLDSELTVLKRRMLAEPTHEGV